MDDAAEAQEESRADRVRDLAAWIAGRLGGIAAVRTLAAVLRTYDAAGGGLVANGLAYSALLALLPGLLLVLSVVALIVDDPGVREQIVAAIARAVPPLEDVSRTALEQVSAGAGPTGVVALLGLVWGSSRFYGALDAAVARIFRSAPRRSFVARTARGLVVSALLVATPVAALVAGSVVSWLIDLAPAGMVIEGALGTVFRVASPFLSFALFVFGAAVVYRLVPTRRVPARALWPPALVAGLAMAVIAQLFAFVAPRLVGVAALFGAFVAVFGVLAWLSISLNVLLLGACWARVRAVSMAEPTTPVGGEPDPAGAGAT
jgi:membrane protein